MALNLQILQKELHSRIILSGGSDGKEDACTTEDPGSFLLLGKSHGQGSLEATVHGVTKSQTQLGD